MSTPDSVHISVALPVLPRLTVVPQPASSMARLRDAIESIRPSVLIAAGLTAILSVGTFSGKLLAVNLSTLLLTDHTETARLLGSISFMSIVAIVASIGLSRRAMRAIPSTDRLSRQVAMVVFALAYLHLMLWFGRVAAAVISSAAAGSLVGFTQNIFWWG